MMMRGKGSCSRPKPSKWALDMMDAIGDALSSGNDVQNALRSH